ncbi:uncharacterized protein PFL1_02273 [Pseudozyma flocculosa PF-1]|uniref:Uncharacterized protein n=1 Tax=Pseudozyma flocculosa TaxID=84751 RepID=A0A5C3F777_9BASI|nr:uncharacterized protein PFL1_02273 [Pseudozyma flocculosa PF-1]EPQ30157.1 hypothetical protein PFL1_02273 [Pseudozyma flocculosa PF-1]SPO39916.1 uncharacterized protein PSFLO_05397 [Pseudozyma flocculosa]
MKFFITLAALACLVSLVIADIATVLRDVDDVNAKLAVLNKSLQSSDGTNYIADLAVGGDVDKLVTSLNKATKDIGAMRVVSVAQADQVLSKLQVSKRTATIAINRLIAIKPNYQKAMVLGLVQGHVSKMATAVNTFANAAVAKTPAARKAKAIALKNAIVADITRGQKAYA